MTNNISVPRVRPGDSNNAPNSTERLLPIDVVAKMLGISCREVYRVVSRGELPHPVKIGTRSLWCASEVFAYIEKLKGKRSLVPA